MLACFKECFKVDKVNDNILDNVIVVNFFVF